jgi:hypothetical protein
VGYRAHLTATITHPALLLINNPQTVRINQELLTLKLLVSDQAAVAQAKVV